jgi:hypothetical protein
MLTEKITFNAVVKESENFGKFVRLNLTGEIVEVVNYTKSEITIRFKGKDLVMSHGDISRIAADEASKHEKNLNDARPQA